LIPEYDEYLELFDDTGFFSPNSSGHTPSCITQNTNDSLSLLSDPFLSFDDNIIYENLPCNDNSIPQLSCSHESDGSRICRNCYQVISPRRKRPKGLQNANKPGVGSGHGEKVTSWCVIENNGETEMEDEGDREEIVEDAHGEFRAPRVRNDRSTSVVVEGSRRLRSGRRNGSVGR
jgi:hypothetical protein